MGAPWGVDPMTHHTMIRHFTMELHLATQSCNKWQSLIGICSGVPCETDGIYRFDVLPLQWIWMTAPLLMSVILFIDVTLVNKQVVMNISAACSSHIEFNRFRYEFLSFRGHFLHRFRCDFLHRFRGHFLHKFKGHFLHRFRDHFLHRFKGHFLHRVQRSLSP